MSLNKLKAKVRELLIKPKKLQEVAERLPDDRINFHCDKTLFAFDAIEISGWALSKDGVDRVEILIDGQPVGLASLGLIRRDLAVAYPEIEDSIIGGFVFFKYLDTALAPGRHSAVVSVVSNTGRSLSTEIPFKISENLASLLSKTDANIYSNHEKIVLAMDYISVSGWAFSLSDIESIQIFVDGTYIGKAKHTLFRADINQKFPSYKNSLISGFCYRDKIEPMLLPGLHTVDIKAVTEHGVITCLSELIAVNVTYDRMPAPDIVLHCDNLILCTDVIDIYGWVLSESGIATLEVYIDGEFIEEAVFISSRLDVWRTYQCMKDIEKGCFCLLKNLREPVPAGNHIVTLRAVSECEFVRQIDIPQQVNQSYSDISTEAPQEIDIDFVSTICLDKIYINGWAFSTDGIKEVEFYLNGKFTDKLFYGFDKPDVVESFPCKTKALKSGICILKDLDNQLLEGDCILTLKIITNRGDTKELSQLKVVSQTYEQHLNSSLLNELMSLDLVYLTPREIYIAGWVVFPGGTSAVEILIDGISYGIVFPAVSRPDIEANFKCYKDSKDCGFSYYAGLLKKLEGGNRVVTIRAKSKDGLLNEKQYFCTIYDIEGSYDKYKINLHEPDRDTAQREIANFTYKPVFSIITPVYNIDPKWLNQCINSVLNQYYDNWELCLYDDASSKAETLECLKSWEGKDKRIKISYGEKNLHISGASNEALKLATGDFIALLDNDDELAPQALFEFAKTLNTNQQLDFIFSDEDKMEEDGKRVEPFFKPDWSLHLLLSMMYTGHLSVYRKSIIDKIGGFRKGFEGSQDYDLVLRFIEQTIPERIAHIPLILYHWKKIQGSVAVVGESKKYAYENAKKAINQYLYRNNIPASAEFSNLLGCYHLKHDLKKNPLISIIIPTKDKADYLSVCIKSILEKTKYNNYEIIIVDTGSTEDKTFIFYSTIKDHSHIKLVQFHRDVFNYSESNNFGVMNSNGEILLFLNNDTKVINSDWLEEMAGYAAMDNVGSVGCKLLYPDDRIQHMGVVVGLMGGAAHVGRFFNDKNWMGFPFLNAKDVVRDVTAVTGACLMVKRKVFDEVNGFDTDFIIAFNDIDFCLRLRRAGYTNIYTPYARLYHHESVSIGTLDDDNRCKTLFAREVELFRSRWNIDSFRDPYFNPHTDENFTIIQPG
ncbi:MAG: glycosyltransferase family 2 protein [Nitrospirae bacterium YQR-1]